MCVGCIQSTAECGGSACQSDACQQGKTHGSIVIMCQAEGGADCCRWDSARGSHRKQI